MYVMAVLLHNKIISLYKCIISIITIVSKLCGFRDRTCYGTTNCSLSSGKFNKSNRPTATVDDQPTGGSIWKNLVLV